MKEDTKWEINTQVQTIVEDNTELQHSQVPNAAQFLYTLHQDLISLTY